MTSRLIWSLTLGLCTLPCVVVAQPAAPPITVNRVSVVDEIGRGVEAEIRWLNERDEENHFYYTNANGVAEPRKICAPNARLTPRPKAAKVYETIDRHPYCQSEVQFKLKMTRVGPVLLHTADRAAAQGQHSSALLLYVESASRFAGTNPALARVAEAKAYDALQPVTNKTIKFYTLDSVEKAPKLTKEGKVFLLEFQARRGLPQTGALDVTTAEAITGASIVPYIKDAYLSFDKGLIKPQ